MNYSKYNCGDIVVVQNPYSDLIGSKTRPVIVISPNWYNDKFNDVIVLKITSKENNLLISYKITNKEIIESKLQKDSYIRIDKPTSIDKTLINYKITELKKDTINQ
jgi:mRNA-degrading endonuclease toxin of MazEF toxin-antitoxin module